MWQPLSPTESRSPPAVDGAQARTKVAGRRFTQVVKLERERVAKYKAACAKIWPEVTTQMKDCGIEEYSVWYDDQTSLLFASFRYPGYDFAGDMQRLTDNSRVQEWWTMTDGCQESLVEGATSSAAVEPS